jgi:hypothetical protein
LANNNSKKETQSNCIVLKMIKCFAGFVFFWGLVFVVSTTLVLIFKHEIDYSIPDNSPTKE